MKEKYDQAIIFFNNGEIDKAKNICLEILKEQPKNFDTLKLFALILFNKQKYVESADLISKAIKIKSNDAEIYNFYSIILVHLKKTDEAIKNWNEAIKIKPDYLEAYFNLGNIFFDIKKFTNAVENYKKAIKLKPNYFKAYNNLGNSQRKLGKFHEAIESYSKAIELKPDYLEAYNSLGNSQRKLGKFHEAIESYSKAIELKPDSIELYYNKANSLKDLRKFEEAIEIYNKALKINPNAANVYYSLGKTFIELNKLEDALSNYSKALNIDPKQDFLLGQLFYLKNRLCDWKDFNENLKKIENKIQKFENIIMPFSSLSIFDKPSLQKIAAETYLNSRYSKSNLLKPIPKIEPNKKIRIGYFSADFRDHAMGYILVRLFELHNKEKFELIGFSLNPVDKSNDEMYKRISVAFDEFIDVSSKNDKEIAQISRNNKIDIAVDLMGFTTNNRFGAFLERCAPIQVNYLGYSGTSGSDCMDYIIADKIVIPKENQKFYSEKIAYMPHCYQANDSEKKISKKIFTKSELGLPEDNFIFCCFNQTYKINPETFDLWTEILKSVNKSVLWLFETDQISSKNLKKEFKLRGLDPNRIIFAKKMPLADHLARHQLADLSIDSFPYTTGVTCSDALWTNLPVLTRIGNSFASRMAASLLTAIDLPEMIVKTKKEYKDLAIELAKDKNKLGQIKSKLKKNRISSPLFNTELFKENIEKLYLTMYQKYQSDLPITNIEIKNKNN